MLKKTQIRFGLRPAVYTLVFSFLLLGASAFADTDPRYYAVEVSASVQSSPARINLVWPADSNATGYTVGRKAFEATSWTTIATLAGNATSYADSNVSSGAAYEYQISKTTSIGYRGYGYIYAGINAPLIENRGKLVLVVDNTYAADLAFELNRLQQDLVGDGWTVLRHDVARDAAVPSVKAVIQSDYQADPANVKAVFLFGHVPVPYSGNMNPDGHGDHVGAWPADSYYGDMDGNWTDASVSNNSAQRQANRNVPGDGKFDQSTLPSDVDLQVGRVDLANMTCYANKPFARSELDLLRQYLNKDHNFRHNLLRVERRGLICDNFGERGGEAFVASGWRNFSAFFGAANNAGVAPWTYFSTLNDNGYLWSDGAGGGSLYACDGIGYSDAFATNDIKSVFTMFVGSYFGDWDNESNFLRAPLGSSTYCLTASWTGRPHWFYHHMGLGQTIGYGARISQNNNGLYQAQNMGTRGVHIALMGDPALRLHPVSPVSSLNVSLAGGVAVLGWAPSIDTDIVGYNVYRANSSAGPFARLNANLLTAPAFTDPGASASSVYMVRAIKLETSGSGTYYNASQGVFYPDTGSAGGSSTPLPPSNLNASSGSSYQVDLAWADNSDNETAFVLQRCVGASGSFTAIATLPPNTTSYSDKPLNPLTQYSYRLCAMNNSGASAFSTAASATTKSSVSVAAAATFIRVDTVTQGNWQGVYGKDGFNIIGDTERYPGYVQVGASGQSLHSWNDQTSDVRALSYVSKAGRLADCWYSPTSFTIDLNFVDGQAHRLALYCMDWDRNGRVQTIEIYDGETGTLFNTQNLASFQEGQYYVWEVKGHIKVKLNHVVGYNAETAGLFFDPPASNNNFASTVSNGQVQLRLNGQIGQTFQILASNDLINWSQIDSVTLSATTQGYSDPSGGASTRRFYRAVPQ